MAEKESTSTPIEDKLNSLCSEILLLANNPGDAQFMAIKLREAIDEAYRKGIEVTAEMVRRADEKRTVLANKEDLQLLLERYLRMNGRSELDLTPTEKDNLQLVIINSSVGVIVEALPNIRQQLDKDPRTTQISKYVPVLKKAILG